MTDDLMTYISRQERALRSRRETSFPDIYLPWTQRVLNPFPLASSGTSWGDMVQPYPVRILAYYCSVIVLTTNNGTNYWTVDLKDDANNTLATFNTSAISAGTTTRFTVSAGSITQPATTNPSLKITPTAALSPGSIRIYPAVAVLRI